MKIGAKFGLLVGGMLGMVLLMLLSIVYGYTHTSWRIVYESFISFNESSEHLIIQQLRMPRALIAAAVGASLAMSGVIMQTLTKNPLASPGILGINAGAGFFVVVGLTVFHINGIQSFAWLAFIGAGFAAFLVFAIGSAGREGLTPMKLTLAGAAIAAMFSSFTQGLLVLNEAALEQVLFWLAGSVQGRKLEMLTAVFPYLAAGWILALLLAGKLNVLAMGEDVARGLGLKIGLIKLVSAIAVVLLAGGAVAIAGPVGFVGIIIPHIARKLIGVDHRWVLPFSGLLGAMLLLAADIGARYVIMPQEVPVGVMTAAIGAPFFIYIARKGIGAR
ncbi:iron complex transport system permease protein [Bacillus ectoiniformans]|uniref:FecCD family ABC transporter permease n=1 Tax=Bacillus ectoiniformans TaxID=1494429 RepID=UPI00195E0341|nr:iron ABC transporter permease [Bacillus ectoiniformans]MBM7648605.1 iron complex transport system permease protein [Bacillus ectoiniformans]